MFFALGLLAVTPVLQQAGVADAPRVHPRRLLVRVDPRFDRIRLDALRSDLRLHELWNLPQIGWRAVEVPSGLLNETKQRLASDPAVLEVEFDPRRALAYTPNDPLYPSQWHMGQIKANLAWDTEKGSPSVVVGVVDTGIELTHPDLVGSLWTNPGEIAANGIDDDGNGYIDDVHGYDFANFDSDPSDDNSHGTACSGIVAATQDNSTGVTGVAPHCKVAAVKAGLSSGYFFASANVPAIVYCGDMGFKVMSMSFYSDEVVPAERDAIRYASNHGVLPVVAAGNDNQVLPYYPAAYPQSLSVGATADAADNRAYFSNWGSWVNVAAPGISLTTTYPTIYGSYTGGFGGTSGATPHVAGLAALLFSANPLATNASVRAAIEDTAVLLNQAPYGKWTNYGRVDADAALDRILGITSGSVAPRLLFAAPCGGSQPKDATAAIGQNKNVDSVPLEVDGVGLESPNTIQVLEGASSLPILAQERHRVLARVPLQPSGIFQLKRNASLVGSWTWEGGPGLLFAATDGSTQDTAGSSASGGWAELYRTDGAYFTCTEDSGGQIYSEYAVRRVSLRHISEMTLEFRRDYDGMNAGAIETVQLYDWSSFSYPYGSWITLSSMAAPTAGFATLTVNVPGDPNLYRDEEGTFYLQITTTNAGASGLLKADMLRFRVF